MSNGRILLDKRFLGSSIKIMKIFSLTLLLTIPLLFQSAWAVQNTLIWDRNNEPDIAGYKIYYGAASRAYTTSIDVGNVTTYTLDLDPAQIYFIAVTAYAKFTPQNESGFSNEVRWPCLDIANFDGDGKTDIALYRNGGWFIMPSSTGIPYGIGFGGDPSDIPLTTNPTLYN